jgi:sulfur relay (sulfurtransferase) DsrF/TusC family protein
VTKFFVHDRSLSERGLTLDDLVIDVEALDDASVAREMASCEIVLPF